MTPSEPNLRVEAAQPLAFAQWLLKQRDRDDALGRLARSIERKLSSYPEDADRFIGTVDRRVARSLLDEEDQRAYRRTLGRAWVEWATRVAPHSAEWHAAFRGES